METQITACVVKSVPSPAFVSFFSRLLPFRYILFFQCFFIEQVKYAVEAQCSGSRLRRRNHADGAPFASAGFTTATTPWFVCILLLLLQPELELDVRLSPRPACFSCIGGVDEMGSRSRQHIWCKLISPCNMQTSNLDQMMS
jgi:hypothetical protein